MLLVSYKNFIGIHIWELALNQGSLEKSSGFFGRLCARVVCLDLTFCGENNCKRLKIGLKMTLGNSFPVRKSTALQAKIVAAAFVGFVGLSQLENSPQRSL